MKHDLMSGTDVAQHALYDPTCVDVDADLEKVAAQTRDGSLLVIETGGDGELGYSLYVDEPLPDAHRARIAKHTTDILLRVPSGHLRASGLENVSEDRSDLQTIDVPAGVYVVDVYELDYEWDVDIAPVLERELGPSYRRENRVGPVGGFAFVLGLFMAIGGLVSWTLWLALIGIASILLGLGVIALALPGADYQARKDAIAMRFPPLALVMHRMSADADLGAYRGAIISLV